MFIPPASINFHHTPTTDRTAVLPKNYRLVLDGPNIGAVIVACPTCNTLSQISAVISRFGDVLSPATCDICLTTHDLNLHAWPYGDYDATTRDFVNVRADENGLHVTQPAETTPGGAARLLPFHAATA